MSRPGSYLVCADWRRPLTYQRLGEAEREMRRTYQKQKRSAALRLLTS
jgi:hypothetical protein